MTIICFDGRYLAADGMKLWGNEIRGMSHKKIGIYARPVTGERVICAFAGCAPMQDTVIDWYLDGAKICEVPKVFDNEANWALLAIDMKGKLVKLSNVCPYPEEFEAPMAIGAGIDMALGLMWAGKSAPDAVEIINKRCNTSGGDILVIDVQSFEDKGIKGQ